MKDNPDWRYLAGLWDGEGCVTVSCKLKKRPNGERYEYWLVRLALNNTSERLVRSLSEEYGGKFFNIKARAGRKPIYGWTVFNSTECAMILRSILPYLRYKDEEARLAIGYFEGVSKHMRGPNASLPQEEIDRRNRIVLAIRSIPGRRKNDANNGRIMTARPLRERVTGRYQ